MVMSIKLLACFLATASAFKVQSKPIEAPLLKLRGGSLADVSVGTVNLVNALYYGGYGVPLLVDGDTFFGPKGMMPYQNKDIEGPIGKFFSKFTGAMFIALSSGYLFDKDSTTLAKQFGIGSALFVPLLIKNAKDEANFNKKLWTLQQFIHIPLTIFTLMKAFK